MDYFDNKTGASGASCNDMDSILESIRQSVSGIEPRIIDLNRPIDDEPSLQPQQSQPCSHEDMMAAAVREIDPLIAILNSKKTAASYEKNHASCGGANDADKILEKLVMEALRPVLLDWIKYNLHTIVKQSVDAKINELVESYQKGL